MIGVSCLSRRIVGVPARCGSSGGFSTSTMPANRSLRPLSSSACRAYDNLRVEWRRCRSTVNSAWLCTFSNACLHSPETDDGFSIKSMLPRDTPPAKQHGTPVRLIVCGEGVIDRQISRQTRRRSRRMPNRHLCSNRPARCEPAFTLNSAFKSSSKSTFCCRSGAMH